jgi:MFS superfamily sulfate permease-like transporter
MNNSTDTGLLNAVLEKLTEVANDAWRDFSIWVQRLDDTEKLFFMVVFILLLLMLILMRARRRASDPTPGRSFVSSILLVMVFSFGAGWMLDSRYDMQHVLNFF